ncbi:B3/4 domain-containing protein [Gemmatimonadota bacterium]
MAEIPQLKIDESLAGKVRLASVVAEGLTVDEGPALWCLLEPFCKELAQRYTDTSIGDVPGVQSARTLYRAIGIDPTKLRPSSEALLRRVLQGKPLYKVNSLVDTINYCSLCFLLPIGLYDLERIEGDIIQLRQGTSGESFEGIRKTEVNLDGRYALFDAGGPFGSPTSDSLRTSIRPETTGCLAVLFAPYEMDEKTLAGHTEFMAMQISRFGGGHPETVMPEITV